MAEIELDPKAVEAGARAAFDAWWDDRGDGWAHSWLATKDQWIKQTRAALSAVLSHTGKPDWQPMDTAPKDGTRFIAARKWASGNIEARVYQWVGSPNCWQAQSDGVCIRPSYQQDYLWCPHPFRTPYRRRDMSARETFRFGDIAEGTHASDDNPHKQGFVVRTGHRQGRMNAGRYVVLTNGKGDFWEYPQDSVRKVGTARILAPGELDPATIERLRAERGEALAAGWVWMPYPSEGDQPLFDVLVVGKVQRFYDDAPAYGEALGKRLGAISTDTAAREKVEQRIRSALQGGET